MTTPDTIPRIRPETPADIAAIGTLTAAAFLHAPHSSHTEHFIIDALRDAGRLSVSLVADDEDVVIGHVAASPVALSSGIERWFGIGPLAVSPERQSQGIGGRLMRHVLGELRRLDARGCVVLGDPRYYGRFGFSAEPSLVLADVPPEYFQAIVFDGALPDAIVTYDAAFAATGG